MTEPLRWHIEQSEAIVVAERTTAARGVRRAVVRELVLGNGHRIGDEVEYVGGSRTSTRPRTARPTVLLFLKPPREPGGPPVGAEWELTGDDAVLALVRRQAEAGERRDAAAIASWCQALCEAGHCWDAHADLVRSRDRAGERPWMVDATGAFTRLARQHLLGQLEKVPLVWREPFRAPPGLLGAGDTHLLLSLLRDVDGNELDTWLLEMLDRLSRCELVPGTLTPTQAVLRTLAHRSGDAHLQALASDADGPLTAGFQQRLRAWLDG